MRTKICVLVLFALLFSLPLLFRRQAEKIDTSADPLVVVTPNSEAIRYEVERAFRDYYRNRTGREVCIDWRTLGGTSEISRYVINAYTANFQYYWAQEKGQPWSDEIATGFLSPWLTDADAAWQARQAFLASNIGVGLDVFFGGGQYDLSKHAASGLLVPAGVRQRHPEWFEGEKPILVERMGGEIWNDSGDCYYATCFSSFGICYNIDRLEQCGIKGGIHTWRELADPRLFNAVGLADPSKSGSINKCFEMLIQREMQDSWDRLKADGEVQNLTEAQILDQGWREAMLLIKQLGGNSAYLTFSASKVPVDTAQGQIAAGMCIDFYGRSQAEWEARHVGRRTMEFVPPLRGTSVSADPVGIMRGAPNRERAEMFIDFLLSYEGQKLWYNRLGTPNGPVKYEQYRLPVRRDLYNEADRQDMISQDVNPFEQAGSFTYKGAWTGPLFDVMRTLIRVMVIDCETELRSCWKAIIDNRQNAAGTAAMEELAALPFEHHQAREIGKELKTADGQARLTREWLFFFREHYAKAQALAENAGGTD